jgi:MSHA biogenesis protein MshN
MSLINKMLQELDRRHAASAPDADSISRHLEPVAAGRRRRDLFWLILVLELAAALAWLAWTGYQLRPQSVVTDLALRSAGGISRAIHAAKPQPAPVAKPAQIAAPQPAPMLPAASTPAQASPPSPAIDTFKLAQSIERPIPPARPRAVTARAKKKPAPKPLLSAPAEETEPEVHKRDHPSTPSQEAEAKFRRAVQWLNQGHVSEAEQGFRAALSLDPSLEPARQALVSLLIDQRRLDEAQNLLRQGLTLDPAQVRFATVLARIFAERDDYAKALDVLRGCKGDVSRDPEYNGLLGAVLQHMSKPGEAADAYRAALRVAPQTGTAWLGLGVSLVALNHRPEAAEAFRRAVATGSLSQDVKNFAEQQLQKLQ